MPFTLLASEIVLLLLPLLQKHDVASLCRTCKRLRSIVVSKLYRTVYWRWDKGDQIYPKVLSSPPVHLLLRSLMQNPDLGEYVEEIDFGGEKQDKLRKTTATIWAAGETPELTATEIGNAIQWARHFQLTQLEVLSEALNNGDIDAYVCLVLAFLPNLHSLALGAHFVTSNSMFVGLLFKQTFKTSQLDTQDVSRAITLPKYTSLQEVKLGRISSDSFNAALQSRFDDLYAFFYLVSLEDLVIELPRSTSFAWPDPPERAPMRCLTSLILPYCEANESALEGVLASKPPLKKLVYDYYCAEYADYHRGYYFSLTTLSLALSHVQPTLESLTLYFEHQEPDADDYPCYSHGPFNGTLASLYDFPQLRYLEAPFVMLSGWEVNPSNIRPLAEMLPTSIDHLCLTDNLADWIGCHWEVKHWLERVGDLLTRRDKSMSGIAERLRTVEVQRKSITYEWEKEEEEEFEKLGERYEVKTFFS